MADKILKKSDRKRKMNFSVSEINKITEKVEQNIDINIIQSKLTNSITNKTRNLGKYYC